MDDDRQIPASLKVVAILFIIGGILSVIDCLGSFLHGHININFGVLGLFIGPGLLALRRGWRTCGLVFLWIAMIGVPLFTVLMLGHSGPLDFKVFGQKVGHASKELGLIFAIIMWALAVWQYRVLTRLDVRRLFGVGTG